MKKLVTSKAIKNYKEEVLNPNKKDLLKEKLPRNVPSYSLALFFQYNTALGPPYRVLVDTNFINFSIQNKLDLEKGMMDCLYAKCDLEVDGLQRILNLKEYPVLIKGPMLMTALLKELFSISATLLQRDRDLKRRIRKIPGVPIMYITKHKYSIERFPEATIDGGSAFIFRVDSAKGESWAVGGCHQRAFTDTNSWFINNFKGKFGHL